VAKPTIVASGQEAGTAASARGGRFVVPDLCNARALALVVLIGQLLVLVLLFAGGPVTWSRLALLSLYVQWIGLSSAGILCVSRRALWRLDGAPAGTVAFAVVVAVTFIVSLVADRVIAGTMALETVGVDWVRIGKQLAVAAIIAGVALRYLYVQQQLRAQEQSELQSRIQALQSRIRPHFLFNSMNIIASLIATDPDTAETVVEDLSELFRASLNEAANQVDIDDELELCERYLRIERLRLGDRLAVEWDIGDHPPELRIPLLTLQPLLENAIYHGIQPRPEGGTIRLTLRCERGTVQIDIVNPLPPPDARGQSQGNRMAISNIRGRLGALYGHAAVLTAEQEGGQFVTRLRYPNGAAPVQHDAALRGHA
jgi:two-component system, LytTR family, sensor histidine kinase AlgZ